MKEYYITIGHINQYLDTITVEVKVEAVDYSSATVKAVAYGRNRWAKEVFVISTREVTVL